MNIYFHLLHALPLKTFANFNTNATTHGASVRINLLWSLESIALYRGHVIYFVTLQNNNNKKKSSQLQYINNHLLESSEFFSTHFNDDIQPHTIVSKIPCLL